MNSCIEVNGLTKQFISKSSGGFIFSLTMHTSTALIGPNGAGKTSANCPCRPLLQPTSGQMMMPNVKDIRRAIGFYHNIRNIILG